MTSRIWPLVSLILAALLIWQHVSQPTPDAVAREGARKAAWFARKQTAEGYEDLIKRRYAPKCDISPQAQTNSCALQ